MKLTRRGKQVRAIFLLAQVILIGVLAHFFLTHHAVYGKCHWIPEGRECTLLRWEKN